MTVDLFLNGPLGLWVLDQVDAAQVGVVNSPSPGICARARNLGMTAHGGWDADPGIEARSRVGISMHYPYILDAQDLSQYDRVYNIHPGLLPWGRCYYPVFWALWANEPAGATLHIIDEGIDTGPIVAQAEVPKYDWDTGGSLHRRVSDTEKGLFLDFWNMAPDFMPASLTQPFGGSFHYRHEFFDLKFRAETGQMSGDEVLRLIRCLSHEQYSGMVVRFGGRAYEITASPVE
jgi:methionyl-tRNA formyltransferase